MMKPTAAASAAGLPDDDEYDLERASFEVGWLREQIDVLSLCISDLDFVEPTPRGKLDRISALARIALDYSAGIAARCERRRS